MSTMQGYTVSNLNPHSTTAPIASPTSSSPFSTTPAASIPTSDRTLPLTMEIFVPANLLIFYVVYDATLDFIYKLNDTVEHARGTPLLTRENLREEVVGRSLGVLVGLIVGLYFIFDMDFYVDSEKQSEEEIADAGEIYLRHALLWSMVAFILGKVLDWTLGYARDWFMVQREQVGGWGKVEGRLVQEGRDEVEKKRTRRRGKKRKL